MAISPPGDIVLDVARAADPTAVAEAHARLVRKAGTAGENIAFEPPETTRSADIRRTSGAVPEAYVKFEGMVLQTFLRSILPDGEESVYGEGMSGEMWKSLLARTLGETMAERGGIGIASRILGDHYVENGDKVPVRGVADGAEQAHKANEDLLSSALVQQMQRRTADRLDSGRDETPLFGPHNDA